MSKVIRITESDLVRIVEKVILEHELGDDVIIRYSDSDCDVHMKGILKQIERMGDYHIFFTPIEGGFNSSCDKRGYDPEAERFVANMERHYNKYIGENLLLKNLNGFVPGPGSNSFNEETMVTIQHLIRVPMSVTITKY